MFTPEKRMRPATPFEDITLDPGVEVLSMLSDQALAEWFKRSLLAAAMSPRFTLKRRRWKRAHMNASRVFGERVRNHAGAACDLCGERPPVSHSAIGEDAALRFIHYCGECASRSPRGWFAMSVLTARPRGADK